ncbi:DUF4395 domain-containing protein [Halalkalibacter sp. APA_J-10(15)]|uniref:DUF4395 domain-containing protein n=1 Tax=unclassified Halalkalibacter TaxID=2893063 RepID=UPI001FF581A0|nr:DUF4395 domain-containing protein [Halalkalibacter sp. APA_J-10(15)]MCK0473116.1 DUF4395 domain-containing protein [Halalkalibacter sp. APA_J-10(15)]
MGIPKPLVQTNQIFILLTVTLSLITSIWLLLVPLTIGLYTLYSRQNPIIKNSYRFLKHPHEKYVQEDPDQQYFNQWIATICIALSLISFLSNQLIFGYLFSIMVIIASALALGGFCIGCVIRYRFLMWKHKRK